MAASEPEKSPEGDDSAYTSELPETKSPGDKEPDAAEQSATVPAAEGEGTGATHPDKPAGTTDAGADSGGGHQGTSAPAGDSASADTPASDEEKPAELHAHHVSKILDEVLQEPAPSETPGRFKHPMILDVILAIGLLVAMGGFTVGMFKMYLTHSAEQSITQNNYKAAIAILKGAPLPGFFTIPGSDPEELLAQALYLDALDRLEVEKDTDGALKQLQEIRPGSRYFVLAQKIIEDHHRPSSTFLQGGTELIETNPDKTPEKRPILPDLPPDGSL
jgi:hypothetical protein